MHQPLPVVVELPAVAALRRAVEIVGGQSELARVIGPPVRQSHVWYWLNRSDGAPARYVLAIERATEGRVRRHELRPELYEASAGAEGVVVVNEQ